MQEWKSGKDWTWTAQQVDGRGQFAKLPTDWQPVAVLSGNIWNPTVAGPAIAALQSASNGTPQMVRASLVKNNELMKALGRPNRDQIVTSRPNLLTTLEAIDLANGQRLYDWIRVGAERALAEHDGNADALTTWLFETALTRAPTAEELSLARELLGEQPTVEAVQDLIWAVLMMPEFQFVR